MIKPEHIAEEIDQKMRSMTGLVISFAIGLFIIGFCSIAFAITESSISKEPQPAVGITPATGANGPRVAGGQRPASHVGESVTVIEAARRDKTPALPASGNT